MSGSRGTGTIPAVTDRMDVILLSLRGLTGYRIAPKSSKGAPKSSEGAPIDSELTSELSEISRQFSEGSSAGSETTPHESEVAANVSMLAELPPVNARHATVIP